MSETELSGIGQRRATALSEGNTDYTAKRYELVRIAAEVFREKGYAAATLNDIARRFGTDRASLYYYFSSKQDLFQACITGITVENLRRARIIVNEVEPPADRLRDLISMLIRSQVEHYPYMYLYMQEDMGRVGTKDEPWAHEMVEITREIERLFFDAIDAGKVAGDFRSDLSTTLVANSIFGMTQWTHRWFVPTQSRYTADDLAFTFAEVLLRGIVASEKLPGPLVHTTSAK